MDSSPILSIEDLHTSFFTRSGVVNAVDGVSMHVKRGETLGVVGESGCGKSVTALSILRLVPDPPGRIIAGRVYFEGEDLLKKSPTEMEDLRGNDISMVFQEPLTALNPVFTIGYQLTEGILRHTGAGTAEARKRALEVLAKVGIPDPQDRMKVFPHQMSGGMRQRAMIAMALACEPKLLIADEPTTALDVTIQAQILALIKSLRQEFGTAVIMITHDLGVIAETADRVVVMYAGRVVEMATVRTLFTRPAHPYTLGLLNSIPKLTGPRGRLVAIPGNVPNLGRLPDGCKFHPRCEFATERCRSEEPPLEQVESGHAARCWHADKVLGLQESAESPQGIST